MVGQGLGWQFGGFRFRDRIRVQGLDLILSPVSAA